MQSTKRSLNDAGSFDELLSAEVEQAKKIQTEKLKRRKLEDSDSTIKKKGALKLRDEKGFKVRAIESNKNGKKRKQEDPDYEVVIENNLRIIKPYYFTYKTFCKQRWRERKLIDIFVTEFRDRKDAYYRKCIEEGSVFINDKVANIDTIVHDGNLITHRIHRHEPPVMATPVKIVREEEDILVIDKPSGIPVHPTGRYRFNSVTKMLERQLGYTVHPCNRLDKLTSGLMFLAKTPKGADVIGDQLKAREVRKEYIARVVGEFPTDEVVVEKSLKTYDPKVALNKICEIDEDGAKHAKTVFSRISFDGQTSIVRCKPLTGRQHQIRVHLQYIGHPIANDPIYSNVSIWGPTLGINGIADFEKISKGLHEIGKTKPIQSWFYRDIQGEVLLDDTCPECDTELCSKPDPAELTLWLHALKYETKSHLDENTDEPNTDWSYQTQYPEWALEGHRKYIDLIKSSMGNGEVKILLVHKNEIISDSTVDEKSNPIVNTVDNYLKRNNCDMLPKGSVLYCGSMELLENLDEISDKLANISAIVTPVKKTGEQEVQKDHQISKSIIDKVIEVPELVE